MSNPITPDHLRNGPQSAQVLSRNLLSQAYSYSQQFHHLSLRVAYLNRQAQGILQQSELLELAQRTTLIQIETLRVKTADIKASTKHGESTVFSSSRSQIIAQAYSETALLHIKLATLKTQITDLTKRRNIVLTHMARAKEGQIQAHGQAWQAYNNYLTHSRQIQQIAPAPIHSVQTDVVTPAIASVAPPPTVSTADPSTHRIVTPAMRPKATASGATAEPQSHHQSARATRRKASPSDKPSLVRKLEDLLASSQEEGYKPTYSPLMFAVKRVIETDEPAALNRAKALLLEELDKRGFLYFFTAEDVSSYLIQALKTRKRVSLTRQRNFLKLYTAKLQVLRVIENSIDTASSEKKQSLTREHETAKQGIATFLLNLNKLNLLPPKLERTLLGKILCEQKSRSRASIHKSLRNKNNPSSPPLALHDALKNQLNLSRKEGYQPEVSELLQIVNNAATAKTTEEVKIADRALEDHALRFQLLTPRNRPPHRLKFLASGLRRKMNFSAKDRATFFSAYKEKIEKLKLLSIQRKLNRSRIKQNNPYHRIRNLQLSIFQLLLTNNRLDLIPEETPLLKLFLNRVINQENQSAHNNNPAKRKAGAMT